MEQNFLEDTKTRLQIIIQPEDSHNRHLVVEILNYALANEAVLVVKTREAQSDVNILDFTEQKFLLDAQYKQLHEIIDEIAERAWMLGGMTIGGFQEFISFIRQEKQPGMAHDLVHILTNHETIARLLGEDANQCRDAYEDEGTFELLVKVMRQHEEMACLLQSLIESGQAVGVTKERTWHDEGSSQQIFSKYINP